MKRRVVQHGLSTLIVSLPSKWAKKYGIKKGDELDVEEYGNSLKLATDNEVECTVKDVDISSLDPLVKRYLIKLYQEGHDQLNITFDKPELIKKVKDALVKQLIGYETIHLRKNNLNLGKDSCIIKDLSGSMADEFDTAYRRIFLILKCMLSEGCEALKNKDSSMLNNISLIDLDINRLVNYCIRWINKREIKNSNIYFTRIFQCERAGDEYKAMIKTILNEKIGLSDNFFRLHEGTVSFFDKVYRFTFNPTREHAIEVAKNFEAIKKEIENSLSENPCPEIKVLFFLRSIMNIIACIQDVGLSQIKDI